jgi:hypothetical protein
MVRYEAIIVVNSLIEIKLVLSVNGTTLVDQIHASLRN